MDARVIREERWETISQDFPGYVVLGVRMDDVDLGTLRLAFEAFTRDSQEQARLAEIDRPTGEQQLAYRRAADSVASDLQSLGSLLLPAAKALAELPDGEGGPEPEQEASPETEAEAEADEADAEAKTDGVSLQDEGTQRRVEEIVRAFATKEMEQTTKEDEYSITAHDYLPAYLDIPPLYSSEHKQNPLAMVKLFTPDSSWTWYITEYDPENDLAFGLAVGFETELGYISIAELRETRGRMGLKIERDVWFRPTPITQVPEWVQTWGEGGPYKSKAEPDVPVHALVFAEKEDPQEEGKDEDTRYGHVGFCGDRYTILNRYVDKAGARYGDGWVVYFKRDLYWVPLFERRHQGLCMNDIASLVTVVAEAERVLGIRIALEGAPADLPDSYPPLPWRERSQEGGAVAEVEAGAEPEPQAEVLSVAEAIAAVEEVRVRDGIDAALEKAKSVRIPEREMLPLPDPWTVEDVRFLLSKLEEGPILVADSELGVRTIHEVAGPVEHLGFGLMQAHNNSYTVDYDAGGAMQQTPSGQSWTFARVKEGEFPYDFDDERGKLWLYLISAATGGEGCPVSDALRSERDETAHNGDGSCVQDEPGSEARDLALDVSEEPEQGALTRAEAEAILECETMPDVKNPAACGGDSSEEKADLFPKNPKQTLTVGMLLAAERVLKAQIADDEPRVVPHGAARVGFFPDLDDVPDRLIWSADVRAYQQEGGERALRTTFEYLKAVGAFFEGMGFQVHQVTKDYDDGTYVYLDRGTVDEPPNRGSFSCEIAPWGKRDVSLHPVMGWTVARRLEALLRECYAPRSEPADWDLPGLDLARRIRELLADAHHAVSASSDVVLWPDLWDAFWRAVGEDEVLKHCDGRWLFAPEDWVKSLNLDVVKPKPPKQWTYLSKEERKGKLAQKYEGDPVALFEALGRGPSKTRLNCLLSALFDAGADIPEGYVPAGKVGAPNRAPAAVEQPTVEQPAAEDLPAPWRMTQRQHQEAKAVRVAGGVPVLNVADEAEHRRLVEEALERGEIIPIRVFEDYPDLWQPWTWTLERWLQMEHAIQRTGPDMRYHAPTGKRTLWPGATSRKDVKRKQHDYEVRVALADGKDVPGEVLADYPDLETERRSVQAKRLAWTYVPADERRGKLAQKYEGDHKALLEALEKEPSGNRLDLLLSALADTGWPVPDRYARPTAAGAPSDQPKPYRPDQLLAPLDGEHVLHLTGTQRHRTWKGEVLRISGPTAPSKGEEARAGQWCAKYGTKDYGPEFFMVGKEIAVKADSAKACAERLQAFLRGYGHRIKIVLQYPKAPCDRVDPGSDEAVKRLREFHRTFPAIRDPERPSRELGWRRKRVGLLSTANARCIGCGQVTNDTLQVRDPSDPSNEAFEYFFRDDAKSPRVAACWTCWRAAGLPDLAEYTHRLAELYREWRVVTGEVAEDREAGTLVLAGMAARTLVLGGGEAEKGKDFCRYCRIRLSERVYQATSGSLYPLSLEDGLEGAVDAYNRGFDFPAPESWACIAQEEPEVDRPDGMQEWWRVGGPDNLVGSSLGYNAFDEVLLRFEDGVVAAFSPHQLFPAGRAQEGGCEDQAVQIKAREGEPCTVVVDDGEIVTVITPAWLYRQWQLYQGAIREDAPDDEETRRIYDAAARRMFRDGEAVDAAFCRFCRCVVQGALLTQKRETWERGFEKGADFAASPGWRDWVPYIGDRTPEPKFEIGDVVHYTWTDEPDTERRSVSSRQWREYEGEWHYKVSGKFWPEKSLVVADPERASASAEEGEPELAVAVDAETLESIHATYSAKLIADGNRIKKPFTVDGADGLWICTGAYGDKKLKCYQVIPREAYAGETDAKAYYAGRVVTYRKQEYVMTDLRLWVTLDESGSQAAPEEADLDLAHLYHEWLSVVGGEPADHLSDDILAKYQKWAEELVMGGEREREGSEFRRFCRVRLQAQVRGLDLDTATHAYRDKRDFAPQDGWECLEETDEHYHNRSWEAGRKPQHPCVRCGKPPDDDGAWTWFCGTKTYLCPACAEDIHEWERQRGKRYKQEVVENDRKMRQARAAARKQAEAEGGRVGKPASKPKLPDGIPAAIEVDLGRSKGWGRATVIAVKGRWLHYQLEASQNGDGQGKVQVIGRDILWREAAQAGGAVQ